MLHQSPYFKFEEYELTNKTIFECEDYDEFHERVSKPIFRNVYKYLTDDGILALQTEKDKKLKDKWSKTMQDIGYTLLQDTVTGQESNKYSKFSKRDQTLLVFRKGGIK